MKNDDFLLQNGRLFCNLRYMALETIDAMRSFVATLPPDEVEKTFFWVDGFSIDEHQGFYGDKGDDNSKVWADTFKQAVKKMGNTVMVLAPWDEPVVLTRCGFRFICGHFHSFCAQLKSFDSIFVKSLQDVVPGEIATP